MHYNSILNISFTLFEGDKYTYIIFPTQDFCGGSEDTLDRGECIRTFYSLI